MSDFESELNTKIKKGESLPPKLDISMLKYFWQASPFTGRRKDSIPKFLRGIDVLKNFSDGELYTLSKYLHQREFKDQELIFKQGQLGVGFYFILSGHVDIVIESQDEEVSHDNDNEIVLSLEKFDYFGEMALLQERSTRNATAIANGFSVVLGFYRPDLDNLISEHPVVATKLLQSISTIIANRLFSLTQEVKALSLRVLQLEKSKNEKE